jgi:hypothetical protein
MNLDSRRCRFIEHTADSSALGAFLYYPDYFFHRHTFMMSPGSLLLQINFVPGIHPAFHIRDRCEAMLYDNPNTGLYMQGPHRLLRNSADELAGGT